MNNKTKICDHCGAMCHIRDTYCKQCSHSLLNAADSSEPIIPDIDNAELKAFLGKNAEYYLKKFTKAKNKTTFLQLNFSALLFGPVWFCYRKMYKPAILYVAVSLAVSALLTVALPAVFQADIDTYYEAKTVYSDYMNADGEVLIFEEDTTAVIGTDPTYQKIRDDLDAAQNKIRLINVLMTAPVFMIHILFRLLANAFYKKHIVANIHSAEGGTSVKSAVIGALLISTATIILSLLVSYIPFVSRFQYASQTLYNWL